ncbi:hypothetical protein ANCCAN_15648 [Ancylostoma caninum]|uniref:Uncharacterized protein n=1 Tax=Ancylostoma caninum TaxID=29170 RepID=A0A368G1W1_ANCCA|nr:hypothetical protein ANCCAN_15648 [Ancylostoma caninum]
MCNRRRKLEKNSHLLTGIRKVLTTSITATVGRREATRIQRLLGRLMLFRRNRLPVVGRTRQEMRFFASFSLRKT